MSTLDNLTSGAVIETITYNLENGNWNLKFKDDIRI